MDYSYIVLGTSIVKAFVGIESLNVAGIANPPVGHLSSEIHLKDPSFSAHENDPAAFHTQDPDHVELICGVHGTQSQVIQVNLIGHAPPLGATAIVLTERPELETQAARGDQP